MDEYEVYNEGFDSWNYGPGLVGGVLHRHHALMEKKFPSQYSYKNVLEIGAGTGLHLDYVKHKFNTYFLTDSNDKMLEQAVKRLQEKGTQVQKNVFTLASGAHVHIMDIDAKCLSFQDASFDRIIASHVLEHISKPQIALKNWFRILAPGGVMSLALPCDPGLAWRLGRYLGPRRKSDLDGSMYDYIMACEHINPIMNLIAIIRHLFSNNRRDERWWPFPIPSPDINLLFTVDIWK